MADGIDSSHDSTATTPGFRRSCLRRRGRGGRPDPRRTAGRDRGAGRRVAGREAEKPQTETTEPPTIESPAIQPPVEPIKPEVWITGPSAEAATDIGVRRRPVPKPSRRCRPSSISPRSRPRPGVAPPPTFLREHATRTIAATPPLRADARPGVKAPPGVNSPVKPPVKPAQPLREAPRQTKFMLLAASVAICACVGAALGSAGLASVMHLPTAVPAAAPAASAEVKGLRETVTQLSTDLAAARSTLEHINKTNGTQFGRIVERFDRAEKAQGDPAASLAKITETLDRLEKRVAAFQVTPPPPVTPAPPPIQSDVVGSITPRPVAEPKTPPNSHPFSTPSCCAASMTASRSSRAQRRHGGRARPVAAGRRAGRRHQAPGRPLGGRHQQGPDRHALRARQRSGSGPYSTRIPIARRCPGIRFIGASGPPPVIAGTGPPPSPDLQIHATLSARGRACRRRSLLPAHRSDRWKEDRMIRLLPCADVVDRLRCRAAARAATAQERHSRASADGRV